MHVKLKYEAYKNSGIEWIGEIPEEWEVRRVKFLLDNKKELNAGMKCNNILSLTMRGVISRSELGEGGLLPSDYSTFQIFYKDDLVFKLIDLENYKTSRVGLAHEKGIMSSAYIRAFPIRKDEAKEKFFYYFYFNLYLQGIFNFIGMGVRSTMNAKDLLEMNVIIPPENEQKQIAEFLDKKTEKIDLIINKKKKLIELLKEKRASLITRTVTKGLDLNVKMKDSGVEWIGKIPEGWNVEKIKFIACLYTGNSISDDRKGDFLNEGNSYPYISSKDINILDNVINYDNGMHIPISKSNFKRAVEGSILLCIEGGSAGKKIGYTDRKVCFVNKLCCIKSEKEGNRFLYYFFRSNNFKDYFSLHLSGLIGGVSTQNLKNFYCFLPNIKTQKQIAEFLDEKTEKIDTAISKTQVQIKKLQEYKSSLIYHAVTGKIKI
jgi:type I restriction enzyme, S subunit